jgi:hypothetical protein
MTKMQAVGMKIVNIFGESKSLYGDGPGLRTADFDNPYTTLAY